MQSCQMLKSPFTPTGPAPLTTPNRAPRIDLGYKERVAILTIRQLGPNAADIVPLPESAFEN